MSLESMVQYISVELKLKKNNEVGVKHRYNRKDDYRNRGHCDQRHQDRQHQEINGDGDETNKENNDININVNYSEPAEYHFFACVAENTKSFGNNRSE